MLNYAEMATDELIDLLFKQEDRVTEEHIEEVIKRSGQAAARLRKILQDEIYFYEGRGGDHFIVVHAITALAAMRDEQACLIMLQMIEHAHFANHESATEALPVALAQFGPPIVDALIKYIGDLRGAHHDSQDYSRCRYTAAAALTRIALENENVQLANRVCDFLCATFNDPQEDDHLFLSLSVACPFVLDRERGLPAIKAAYDRRAIAPQIAGNYKDCIADLKDPESRLYHDLETDLLGFYQPDQIGFRQRQRAEAEEEKLYWGNEELVVPAGYSVGEGGNAIRTEKIGRNDPCPCGSGKKYKKCCGQ